jgi:arylformamidase
MELSFRAGGRNYVVDTSRAHDLSIAVRFDSEQVAAFGAAAAVSVPLQAGSFVGSVARGGSCNCDVHTFCAHTAGTHTECVGHLAQQPVAVCDVLRETLWPATVITLPAEEGAISRGELEQALAASDAEFLRALVVRTLPNSLAKRARDYNAEPARYFAPDAVQLLRDRGVQHLLVDLPSLDRADDTALTCHRIFWELPPAGHTLPAGPICARTVTELIFADNNISDGHYLLDLQVAPIRADAAPSRPMLYEVTAR